MTQHTPGPWRWEVNRKHRTVQLCGGEPKEGFGRYDKTVLSFRRWGLQGATPVFWFWKDGRNWSEEPKTAAALAVPAEGREHHRDWFALIDHPDARLIAAAPDHHAVAVELHRLSLVIESAVRNADPAHRDDVVALINANRAAIAKTEGSR